MMISTTNTNLPNVRCDTLRVSSMDVGDDLQAAILTELSEWFEDHPGTVLLSCHFDASDDHTAVCVQGGYSTPAERLLAYVHGLVTFSQSASLIYEVPARMITR